MNRVQLSHTIFHLYLKYSILSLHLTCDHSTIFALKIDPHKSTTKTIKYFLGKHTLWSIVLMQVAEGEQSLVELRLVPAIVFNFEWDPDVQDPNLDDSVYLKPEILMLLHERAWGGKIINLSCFPYHLYCPLPSFDNNRWPNLHCKI